LQLNFLRYDNHCANSRREIQFSVDARAINIIRAPVMIIRPRNASNL